VPGQGDVRVGCAGRRHAGRHRRDTPGIGEHQDQGGLDPGRAEAGVIDEAPSAAAAGAAFSRCSPPRSGSGTYAAGMPRAASSAHVIAPERQITKSAAAAPDTAALIAPGARQAAGDRQHRPVGSQAEPLTGCAAQRGPVEPGVRRPQRDAGGGGVSQPDTPAQR
jgi:hypothetical protein